MMEMRPAFTGIGLAAVPAVSVARAEARKQLEFELE